MRLGRDGSGAVVSGTLGQRRRRVAKARRERGEHQVTSERREGGIGAAARARSEWPEEAVTPGPAGRGCRPRGSAPSRRAPQPARRPSRRRGLSRRARRHRDATRGCARRRPRCAAVRRGRRSSPRTRVRSLRVGGREWGQVATGARGGSLGLVGSAVKPAASTRGIWLPDPATATFVAGGCDGPDHGQQGVEVTGAADEGEEGAHLAGSASSPAPACPRPCRPGCARSRRRSR